MKFEAYLDSKKEMFSKAPITGPERDLMEMSFRDGQALSAPSRADAGAVTVETNVLEGVKIDLGQIVKNLVHATGWKDHDSDLIKESKLLAESSLSRLRAPAAPVTVEGVNLDEVAERLADVAASQVLVSKHSDTYKDILRSIKSVLPQLLLGPCEKRPTCSEESCDPCIERDIARLSAPAAPAPVDVKVIKEIDALESRLYSTSLSSVTIKSIIEPFRADILPLLHPAKGAEPVTVEGVERYEPGYGEAMHKIKDGRFIKHADILTRLQSAGVAGE